MCRNDKKVIAVVGATGLQGGAVDLIKISWF